jgi:hypothetical protein
VLERTGLVLGEDDDLTRSLCEPFEHWWNGIVPKGCDWPGAAA